MPKRRKESLAVTSMVDNQRSIKHQAKVFHIEQEQAVIPSLTATNNENFCCKTLI